AGRAPGLPVRIAPLVRTASGKNGHPGAVHFVPPPGHAKEAPGEDQGSSGFHRPTPPGESSPGPPEPAPQGQPAQPSGSPDAGSGAGEVEPERRISRSR